MLKKFLIVCNIVLAIVATPVVAKHGSNDSYEVKASYNSEREYKSKCSQDLHRSSDNDCDIYIKQADKAYAKYLKYKKKYTNCKNSIDNYGLQCKKKEHRSKAKHYNSHRNNNKQCSKYREKAD